MSPYRARHKVGRKNPIQLQPESDITAQKFGLRLGGPGLGPEKGEGKTLESENGMRKRQEPEKGESQRQEPANGKDTRQGPEEETKIGVQKLRSRTVGFGLEMLR